MACQKDEKEAEKPPPSELQFGTKPKIHKLNKKEFELLYIEVLYTIKHKIGATSGGHLPFIQPLYQYAQEAFGVTPEDHAWLLARATEEKAPILILNIAVLGARGLEAKDADGFSDPYCMLGIMPVKDADGDSAVYSSDEDNPRKEKKGPLKKFSTSLKKKKEKSLAIRDLLPAKYIRTTAVKPNTLNPIWNERFRVDLDSVETDRLHLDIWDHDDEFSVFDAAKTLNEVSGLKGLGRFFKQIAQSARTSSSESVDDFLGCVNVALSDIPSTGIDQWYDLEGRSSRSTVQGQIHLKLSLATREDQGIAEDDNWTDIKQHEDLMCIFIEREIRKFQGATYKWNGELSQAARTILHQHAIQGDITEVQQAMCRWTSYSRKHMEHPFDYSLLLTLLDNCEKLWEPASLSRDEEESLAESFNIFIEFCLNLIRKQREIFPPTNKAAYNRLDYMLRCLAQIYSMKLFKQCCPFQKELHSEVISVVKKGTLEWYERMFSMTKSQCKDEDVLLSLIELGNVLNTDMHRAVLFYDKLFKSIVGVQYFNLTYKQLEKLLADDVNRALEEELGEELNREMEGGAKISDKEGQSYSASSTMMGTTLFELYLALQEFAKFKEHLQPNEIQSLSITQFFEWFRFAVHRWLTIAKQKALKRIRKAVELDKVAQMDVSVKYSTSAVDVCCCFTQITDFWKQLDWPDPVTGYRFVVKLTEDICHCAVLYAELIHEKLAAAGYYDEEGQFDVTEQLCITINNIEQVRRSLKPLSDVLMSSEANSQERSTGDRGGRTSKGTRQTLIKNVDDDMVSKIKQVVDRVADKMRPDIKKDVFHLNWAPESVPADDAIGDLLEYLDSNLLTLNNNLLKANFERILASIWVEVLEEIRDSMIKEDVKQNSFYQRLYDALGLLVEFFHANEKGLPMQTILSKQYQALREQLYLRKLDTADLIDKYYLEKLEEQKVQSRGEYGYLNVRVCYRYDSQTLLVEVLNAKDIIPLDANGLSDPFVLIQMCPSSVFPNIIVQKTKIVKKSLNPTFDESFEFAVSSDACRRKGAALVFTVMDHDFMFQNDFAGEVYVALNEVPGVNGEDVSGYDALHTQSLLLMQPKHKEFGAFEILAGREGDKDAQEFVKKRSKVEEQKN